ncbi:MAG: hypothetical protein GEU90_09980 [Gemmatimonas sp.]|nr:hypothetical protein [Gemmatimonas sp.]
MNRPWGASTAWEGGAIPGQGRAYRNPARWDSVEGDGTIHKVFEEESMSGYEKDGGLPGKLLTWLVVGVLAVVALKVGLVVGGFVLRLGFSALFTLGPIVLLGWVVWKVVRYMTRRPDEITV